jgi:hypothetical protein
MGEVIKIKMPDSPPFADGDSVSGDDLTWVWDVSAGKLRQAKISDLPFSNSGGGGGDNDPVITNPSPFMVFNSSDSYSYNVETNTVTISDIRLKNRSLYPVLTTQFGGGEFNPEMIEYVDIDPNDDSKGQVIISGFQLDEGQHISLIVPGNTSGSDTSYTQLQADVALLKLIAAPFLKTVLGVNGGKVLWGRPANEIPAGWQEYQEMRGFLPMAQDPVDADFGKAIGSTGGVKSIKMKLANLIEHAHKFIKIQTGGNGTTSGYVRGQSQGNIDKDTEKAGSPDPEPMNVLNPYRIVMWIEFVGL